MFFLMRYQSAVASRREVSFARQLFRISFFMVTMEQNFAEPLPESLRRKIPLEPAPMTNRNRAGLFGNDDRNRVRFLGNAKRGAMPQSQTAIERLPLADREDASRGRDPAVSQDHAAVVQRRFGMKEREQQFSRKSPV